MSIQLVNDFDGWFWSLLFGAITVIISIYLAIKNNRKLSIIYIFRLFALIIVLFLLLQPKVSWNKSIQHPMHWNVYIDKSVSMAYHQSLSPKLFLDEIQKMVRSIREIDSDAEVFTFDQTIQEYDGQPIETNGAVTDISNIFLHISEMQEDMIGAIIISDGQVTKGNIDQNQLEKIRSPIYTIGVGDTIPMVDIAVQSISAPTIAIKGEEMDINATIMAQGVVNERINVLLYNKSKLIGSKYFRLSGGGSLSTAKFRVSSGTLGINKYLIKASVLKDEINIRNNQLPFEVAILKDRYNIALITGAPNFNTGPIKKSINAFPRASLDHYIQIGNSFTPTLSEFWSKPYELIIFDNFPLNPVSNRWQKIFAKKLIAGKSSLFYFAGPNITPKAAESLYPFLHVHNSQSSPKETGKMNWYWVENINNKPMDLYPFNPSENYEPSLPPLTPKLTVEPDENTRILVSYENNVSPMLLISDKDGLRSAIWTASEFSMLYYKLTESESADYSMDLMDNMYGWLLRTSGENELYFRLNKNVYQQGEEIYVSGTHAEFNENDIGQTVGYINLNQDDKVVRSFELNYNPVDKRWEKRFIAGKAGNYSYSIHMDIHENSFEQKGRFVIDESQIELNNVSVNSSYLTSISHQTNGKYIPWESRADIMQYINDNVKSELVLKTAEFQESYIMIFIIIILLSIEWYIRRFIGLT